MPNDFTTDIAPELLEKVNKRFLEFIQKDKKISGLIKKLATDTVTYDDANAFAERYGELLSRALRMEIDGSVLPDGKMYYNIAQKIVTPVLTEEYAQVADYCEVVQKLANEIAGIGLNAVRPELNTDRIQGFLERLSLEPSFDTVNWLFGEPIVNFAMSVVDDTIKANIEMQTTAGLNPQAVRKSSYKCCEWCSQLVGTYSYPVPREVFQRHENCRCTVTYDGSKLKAYRGQKKASKNRVNTFRSD